MDRNLYAPPSATVADTRPAPRSLEYRIGYWDRVFFTLHHQFTSPVILFVFVSGPVVITLLEHAKSSWPVAIIMGIVFWLGAWIFQALMSMLALYTRRADTELTAHALEVCEDGLNDRTDFANTRYYWRAVRKVVARGRCIAVYVTQHSALLVPKRVFASDVERDSFIADIRSKSTTARSALPRN